MTVNPVRSTIPGLVEGHSVGPVSIQDAAVSQLAGEIAAEPLSLPDWDTPALPDTTTVDPATVFDLLLLANSLNFQFDHYDTGATFQTTYAGETWTGAFGLFACFTRALENGIPITAGEYLADLDRRDVATLLDGDPSMPMLPARHRILTHIGDRLESMAGDSFHDAIPGTGPYRPFDDGDGIVDWLLRSFPAAYNDVRTVDGETIPFQKKAQLAAALLAGRFGHDSPFGVSDVSELTLFADYVIPAVLRSAGVLDYDAGLADRVDNHRIIPVDSSAEIGIRAATIVAGDRLLDAINDQRAEAITAVHLDQYLWRSGRRGAGPFHRTPTTSY